MPSPFEIREEWAFEVAAASQHLVGKIVGADPVSFRQAFADLHGDMPNSASLAERALLVDRIAVLAIRAGHHFDSCFHRTFQSSPCDGGLLDRTLHILSDGRSDPIESASTWALAFLADFSAHHTWPIAERARQYLDQHYHEPLDVAGLVRRFGCSRSALARAFLAATDSTLKGYQTSVRIVTAIIIMRERDWKIDAVARLVGYGSPKNFYHALRVCTGLSPTDVRTLDSATVGRIVDNLRELLRARSPGESRPRHR